MLPADVELVGMAIGIRPNVARAKAADLEVNRGTGVDDGVAVVLTGTRKTAEMQKLVRKLGGEPWLRPLQRIGSMLVALAEHFGEDGDDADTYRGTTGIRGCLGERRARM